MNGIGILKIPDGIKHTGNGFMTVQSPCDWLLIKNGRCALVDTKTYDGKRMSANRVKPHQIKAMQSMTYHGANGGYVVWFREINLVVWFSCAILANLPEDSGVGPEDGIELGPIERVNFKPLFEETSGG